MAPKGLAAECRVLWSIVNKPGEGDKMFRDMDRREFLKATSVAGAALIAGGVKTVGSGMTDAAPATPGSVKVPEVSRLVLTVITDNYFDCLRPNDKIAKRHFIGPDKSIHAEHGLAYFVETTVNGEPHSFMFDFGLDYQGIKKNMQLLKLDVSKIEAMGLSHGHFDHWGGLFSLLKDNKDKIKKGIPFYVGEESFAQRYADMPPGPFDPISGLVDLGILDRKELDAMEQVKVVEIKDPTPIVPGAYLTGNIDRVTDYEKGSPFLLIKRGDEHEKDLFQGEQALIFHVTGKGLVVVSSCAHAGIVNTVKHAQRITGTEKVNAVIGGFHLTGAKPEIIQRTIADIKALNPEIVVPMHCTGFEAITAFAKEMPGQFIINTAGTRYVFAA